VFVSYSHNDDRWLDRLLLRLPLSVRKQTWTDKDIKAGDTWREEIERALARARVAVLLVTQDFLESKFIASSELPQILEAAKIEGLRVLWVAIKSSGYSTSPIAKYQPLSDPERPLAGLHGAEREDVLLDIAAKVAEAVQGSSAQPAMSHFKAKRSLQTQDISDYIQKHSPKRIDILHFSMMALSTDAFWEAFKGCRDAKIRILLIDPERAARRYSHGELNRDNVKRIAAQVEELETEQQADPNRPTVGIWYYDHAPSVAAVIVDEGLIQLGWYFVRADSAQPSQLKVSGHDCPGVLALGDEAKILLPKVRAHFDAVLAGIKREPLLFGPQQNELITEWRELQSRGVPQPASTSS